MIQDLLHSQEAKIDSLIKQTNEYLEAHTRESVVWAKDLVVKSFNNAVVPLVMDYLRKGLW